jgi:nucleotide-binding universal stress UspA family protein
MTKRILVPVGRHDDAEPVLTMVADLARGAGATVRLLHVMPVPATVTVPYGRVVAYASQLVDGLESRGRAHLDRARVMLEGVPVEESVRFGDEAEEIVEEAVTFGADVIALHAKRRPWWPWGDGLRLGGVARRVARRAKTAVMVLAC